MQTNNRSKRFFIQLLFIVLFGMGFLALVDIIYSWRFGRVKSIYHLPVFLPIGIALITTLIMASFLWMGVFRINIYQRPKYITPLRFWLLLSLCLITIIGTSYTYFMYQAAHMLARHRVTQDIFSEAICLFFFWLHLIAFLGIIKANLSNK